jgi:hypothetical protein
VEVGGGWDVRVSGVGYVGGWGWGSVGGVG